MADDSVARQPRRTIIKIKFGNTVVGTQSVRVTGLVSSASQDSKDVKSGSALTRLARLRQASLKGYVPPNASADTIVARLREGEGFAPGAELPPWNFTAPPTKDADERPAKRLKQTAVAVAGCLEPSSSSAPGAEGAAVGTRCEVQQATVSRRPEPTVEVKPVSLKAAESVPERAAGVPPGSGESNSDQATNSQAYLPLSPDDAADASGRATIGGAPQPHASSGGQSSLASSVQLATLAAQRLRPPESSAVASSSVADGGTQASERSSAPAPPARGASGRPITACSPAAPRGADQQPSASGRQHQPQQSACAAAASAARAPSGVSVETQTSQRDFPVLPTSFLELTRLSGTAHAYQSIGPYDLQLEHDQRGPVVPPGGVEAMLTEARRVKKEGDALCHKNGRAWTIKSLSKYVMSALAFMEAAEALLRDRSGGSRHARAAGLYRQTADLLGHTVNFCDSIMRSNGVGKEALRLLAERLCAVCLLRQATLLATNFKACADKAQAALREHQRHQAALGQAAGGSAGGGPQPSPEDSSTSSHHHAGVSGGTAAASAQASGRAAAAGGAGTSQSLPGFGPEQVAELLDYARTTCRFAEQLKRSNKSFEAFLERADVRQDQQAKMVCVHLAALCMDIGMAPGMRVIHHAREAVRTLCEDLAR